MEVRRLTDLRQVEEIYQTRMRQDFARNELRPLSSLRRSWRQGSYDCFGLFEGETLLGYAFFVRQDMEGKTAYLFDYLAVAEDCRDKGLGSVFLQQLADRIRDADCILGEVEDPDAAESGADRALRQRRLDFYLRAAYRDTGLRSRVFGVHYRLLEIPTGQEHREEELGKIYADLYRSILPDIFFKTQFTLL